MSNLFVAFLGAFFLMMSLNGCGAGLRTPPRDLNKQKVNPDLITPADPEAAETIRVNRVNGQFVRAKVIQSWISKASNTELRAEYTLEAVNGEAPGYRLHLTQFGADHLVAVDESIKMTGAVALQLDDIFNGKAFLIAQDRPNQGPIRLDVTLYSNKADALPFQILDPQVEMNLRVQPSLFDVLPGLIEKAMDAKQSSALNCEKVKLYGLWTREYTDAEEHVVYAQSTLTPAPLREEDGPGIERYTGVDSSTTEGCFGTIDVKPGEKIEYVFDGNSCVLNQVAASGIKKSFKLVQASLANPAQGGIPTEMVLQVCQDSSCKTFNEAEKPLKVKRVALERILTPGL